MTDLKICINAAVSVLNYKLITCKSSGWKAETDLETITISNEDIKLSGVSFLDFYKGLGFLQSKGHIFVRGDYTDEYTSETEIGVDVVNDGSWYDYEIPNIENGDNNIIFNLESGIFKIKGKNIKISHRSKKTDAHQLLAYLAKNPKDILDYSDMPYDVFGEQYNWKKYYNAAQDIKNKIMKEVKIIDFINFTSGESGNVSISEKYQDNITVSV